MKKTILIIFALFISLATYATHNRGGEITYRQISQYTYEITLYTYTYTKPGVHADRPELEIFWGDNTSDIVPRVEEFLLPYYYKRNKYVWTHTYPGPGTYQILAEDPNRNEGVDNIKNSVGVIFAVKTTLKIDPIIGFNNTPVLLNPPYDKAFKGVPFIHNPSAYDPDGDSISYKLTYCLGEDGKELTNVFTYPEASKSLTINPITGDLIWDSPVSVGIFNIAIAIEEWREGVKIGQIIRDMQVEVFNTDNNPPDIKPIPDICVMAGETVEFDVTATDPDTIFIDKTIISKDPPFDTTIVVTEYLDTLIITATGGPLIVENPAEFPKETRGFGKVSAKFYWETGCQHLRKSDYQMTFKVEDARSYIRPDVESDNLKMVDFENVSIGIVSPAPTNFIADPTYKSVNLSWEYDGCQNAVGYKIYRRVNPSGFVAENCITGVPEYTGYKLIKTIDGIENLSFVDDNELNGLLQGVEYCYMITAVFPDGTESYASAETCTVLKQGIPAITNVSVNYTDQTNGSIFLKWVKPIEIDTLVAKGPFRYLIYRSEGFRGENFQLIDSIDGIDNTSIVDTMLNTLNNAYSYKVEFWNVAPGERFLVGTPQIASSTFLDVFAGAGNQLRVNIANNTPWVDTAYIVYRKRPGMTDFDSIGYTNNNYFIDRELSNGKTYCYYVEAIGYYSLDSVQNPLINFSQESCKEVLDTIPPCAPPLTVVNDCDNKVNNLKWSRPLDKCGADIMKYNIYYTAFLDSSFKQIKTINSPDITAFSHNPEVESPFPDYITMAGCYAITAIDSFENETPITKRVCVDACPFYKLPNVFSPNNDNKNDLYTPIDYESYIHFVEKVDLKIYNRWGKIVFETDNPMIEWDGTDIESKTKVADGVYYYVCDVYERRITGIESRYIVGFIHVFGEESAKSP